MSVQERQLLEKSGDGYSSVPHHHDQRKPADKTVMSIQYSAIDDFEMAQFSSIYYPPFKNPSIAFCRTEKRRQVLDLNKFVYNFIVNPLKICHQLLDHILILYIQFTF
uniref:Uncharacterized protein n=1 Tax=Pararge aegeria TaxID=116150 RepID=S4NN17_9NEOP